MKIGVFVCHCGSNIEATVDTATVAKIALTYPDVVFSEDTMYTCSEPGQENIVQAIKTHGLDGVVVASCSPRMHEPTFRRTVERAGLNRYMFEMANIREHVSWIGRDREANTNKAAELVRLAVEKLRRNTPLYAKQFDVTKRVLVIGGGVAGIQAALDAADSGIGVVMVERESTIGGKMAKLDKTFPTIDCSSCVLAPKMVDVAQNPNITLYAHSEVERISGFVGNFTVKIRKRATYVDWTKCTGCGTCTEKCPTKNVPDAFNEGHQQLPAPSTFPSRRPFQEGHHQPRLLPQDQGRQVRRVRQGVPHRAIVYDMVDEIVEEKVGAIIAATGYDLVDWTVYKEYGGGAYPDVITSLQYERMMSASGPHWRSHPSSFRRHGAQKHRVHPVRGLPRLLHRPPVLLRLLLHVHGQAGHHDQGSSARFRSLRVLHGHPRSGQDVRRIHPSRSGRVRRAVHPRPRVRHSADGSSRRQGGLIDIRIAPCSVSR